MSGLGVEHGEFIGVPVPEGLDRPPVDARFYFREESGDKILFHHPFHSYRTLGDTSVISDKHIDAAAVVLFKHLPYLVDAMKLNRPRRFETRPYAGEYAQLSHCISLGIIGQEFGGGPMDKLDALFNDASHIYDGHQGDDNYQGHGQETLADLTRRSFFDRSGLVQALIDSEALRKTDQGILVGNTRLAIASLLDEDEAVVRRTFLSNKHEARRLDGDKFQYNSEESFYLRIGLQKDMPEPARVAFALANASLNTTTRMIVVENGEGDQLVATDAEIAWRDVKEYFDHNAEHWCEPVQDLLNDILNLVERYFFVCSHPVARQFQYFYPRDYLHTSSTLMFERFDQVAKDDPVMDWLLKLAEYIAADQRQKTIVNHTNGHKYHGPNPPDGIQLRRAEVPVADTRFVVTHGKLVAHLPQGKIRKMDTRVSNSAGQTFPISLIKLQEYADYEHETQQWIGDYIAEIDIEDPAIQDALDTALRMVEHEWPRALAIRPPMPADELQASIREANAYVKAKGKFRIG